MREICVIDDDEDVREVVAFALETEGYMVHQFENGQKALDHLLTLQRSDYPGLIIVDHLMPTMDGLTFISKIKSEHRDSFGLIPVALSSANDFRQAYPGLPPEIIKLNKPMNLDDLIKLASEHCRIG
ncbi:MAG TPA: response regulator [Bacteriovoracaceae bacterium]|nr:response regulator [Bacteriovoracaceae bacterium]